MKRQFAIAAAAVFGTMALAAGPALSETVIKAKKHEVVVKHVPGHPYRVMMVRPKEHRPGMFWHRGVWKVRIRGPVFHYPHGWHFRRWAVGAVLPGIFLTDAYYYNEYAAAGLNAPPPGYRWVRYGSDLLLVNIRTGEVEDTAEDVFE